jgi:hypothetical protein
MKSIFAALLLLSTSAVAQPGKDVDFLRGPTNQILFASAGSVPGSGGTFFHSDISLFNYRDTAQTVRILFLKQGQNGNNAPVRNLTLPARTGVVSDDFIAEVLQDSGVGALLITAVTSSGTVDPGGLLYATERVWTRQTNTLSGTASQTFPAIPTGSILAASQVTILGQRIEDQYRTNVGIVNLDSTSARVFDILQNTDDPTFAPVVTTVTVQPLSFEQVSLPNFKSSALQIVVTPRTPIDSRLWVTYGSSVDNQTGDSWSQLGFPLLTQ